MAKARQQIYTARLLVSLSPAELETWRQRARDEGKSVSEWIRGQCALTVKKAFVDDRGIKHGEHAIADSPTDAVRPSGESGMAQRRAGVSSGAPRGAGGTAPKKRKVCPHGKGKGYHCWQCKGLAKVRG